MKRPSGRRPRRRHARQATRRVFRVLTEGEITEPGYLTRWARLNRCPTTHGPRLPMISRPPGSAPRRSTNATPATVPRPGRTRAPACGAWWIGCGAVWKRNRIDDLITCLHGLAEAQEKEAAEDAARVRAGVEKVAPMRQEVPRRLVAFIMLGANMTRLSIGLIVPLVALVLSIPMILGKVPPNSAYGFRTPKTLSSEDVWYPANRAAGWFMLAAMVVSICFNVALWWTFPDWSLERATLWMTGGTMIPLAFSVLASFLYLGRL